MSKGTINITDIDFNNARVQEVLDNIPVHIIFADVNGVVLFANKAAVQNTGYTKGELIGNNTNLWGRQMSKEFYVNMWNELKDKNKPFDGEVLNKRKDGRLYSAYIKIHPVYSIDNFLVGFIGIEIDITSSKIVEKKLKIVNARFAELNELRTDFMNMAVHEMRTPLGAMKWNLETLFKKEGNNLSERAREILDQVCISNDRMIEMVNEFMMIAELENNKFANSVREKVLISDVIQDVIDECEPLANEKHGEIIFEEYSKISAQIDRKQLYNVILNLVSNAVKYSNSQKCEVVIKLIENENIEISFTDNGIGISTEDYPKIFNKFFRGQNAKDRKISGTGLGLYMIKKIVESWGGYINFHSTLNKGTTFYIIFPKDTNHER